MADSNDKVKIDIDVSTTGEDTVNNLIKTLHALDRSTKSINANMKAIGRVSSPGGSSAAKDEAALEGVKARGRRSKKQADADAIRASQRVNMFDAESVRLLKTRMTVQSQAAVQAAKASRQEYANFRTRNAAQTRYETAQIRALKDRMTAESRIGRMRNSAENDAISALKTRLSTQNRAYRQRVSEERSAQREQVRSIAETARAEATRMRERAASIRATARLEETEARRVDRARTSRENARNRYISNVRSGGESIREGTGRAVRGAATVAAVGTGAVAAATRKGIDTRLDVDTAETNLKIFSGQTNEQIKAARKGFLDNLSIKNGLGIAGGLDAYSEVLKTGMKAPAENVKTIMEAVSALELDLKNTTKLAGLIDRNAGASSNPTRIKSALNAVAVAAREDPTQSNEIVEGVKRAFGALSTGNMTAEQLTALVSGGQSVGIQPGKAGTYVATLGKQLSMGNSKFLGKKNRDELDFAAKELGFGDARKMASDYAKDSYGTMMKFHENLAKMESGKRTQVAEAALGRQWSDEGLQFSQGAGGVKKTYSEISDPKNANFLEEAAKIRADSLQGQWNSTKTIFGRFWDAFGSGFEDILTSINRYFLELNSTFDYDRVKSYVVDFFDGVKEALGVSTWTELLRNVFGGEVGNIGPQIKAFAKGLTEGVMSVGSAIKSFAGIFTGGDTSAESIGNLTGKLLGLTLAAVAFAPVLTILGGLASVVMGLAVAGKAIAGLAGLTGGVTSGAGAGLMRGFGLALSRMFALGLAAEIGANRGVISTWLLDAGKSILQAAVDGLKAAFSKESIQAAMKGIVSEFIPAPVQRWLDNDGKLEEKNGLGKKTLEGLPKGIPAAPVAPVAPTERGYLGKAWDWLSSSLVGSANANEFIPPPKGTNPASTPTLDPRPAIEEKASAVQANPLIQQQNFGSDGELRSLIHKASFSAPEAVLSGTVDTASIAKPTADPRLQLVNLTHAVEENTSAIRAGLDRQGIMGGLVHRASITTASDGVKASLAGSSADIRSASSVMSGSTGSGTVTGGLAPLEGSAPGSPLAGGSGLSRRGIIGGGGDGGLGGGVTPPMMRGQGAENAKASYDFFRSKGLSHEATAGILASMKQESGFNPQSRGDGGRAHGLFQHHPDRRAAIQQATGINMSTAGLQDQLKGTWWEMQNGDAGAQRALRILKTPGISARDAGGAFVQHFERPARDERASRGALAEGFAREYGAGGKPASQVIGGSVGTEAASNVADNASKLVGLGSSQAATALGSRMTPGQWCADFVNGSLKSANIKGVNSSIANSFLGWGKEVTDGVKAGDVLVEHRGRGVGQTGGHAGIATGNQRMRNGQLQYEQISGNFGGRVARNWENASGVIARRALEATNNAVAASKAPAAAMKRSTDWSAIPSPVSGNLGGIAEKAKEIRGSSWKPSTDAAPTSTLEGVAPGKPSITDAVPAAAIERVTGGGGRSGGAGGSSSTTTINNHINGTGLNSEEIANAVNRKSSGEMRRQTGSVNPFSFA
ncbi:phage tail tip lysozyme [Methylobacterium sp. WCS2018Hpa-22]|uniref:phage tail tip lysozyme n=1 Tax=Methylobacterium sp. WCS2018Hpa-22 TaxID=3073633 RepID=UPI0028893836|nr:phage tail tip lysozyme [Methylobacterium sp. WCS2018Hpa-22]